MFVNRFFYLLETLDNSLHESKSFIFILQIRDVFILDLFDHRDHESDTKLSIYEQDTKTIGRRLTSFSFCNKNRFA